MKQVFASDVNCQHDNEVPALYSAVNNMDPGPVPLELCVSSIIYQQAIITNVKRILHISL